MKNNLIELAERSTDGVGVRILWRSGTREFVLEVTDQKTGRSFETEVPGDRAMDAFHHPFVYIAPAPALFDKAV